MHEPPIQFEPNGDTRPLGVWILVLVVLIGLHWLGLDCLFGLCGLQGEWWFAFAAGGATAAMLLSDVVFRLIDRIRDR